MLKREARTLPHFSKGETLHQEVPKISLNFYMYRNPISDWDKPF